MRRVQARYASAKWLVAIARSARARACGTSRTIGGFGARLPFFRSAYALLADRRRSDDALVIPVTRFSSVTELPVVAVRINLALHALGPRIVAITEALPACSAILVSRTCRTRRLGAHEASFGARYRRARLAKAGG